MVFGMVGGSGAVYGDAGGDDWMGDNTFCYLVYGMGGVCKD